MGPDKNTIVILLIFNLSGSHYTSTRARIFKRLWSPGIDSKEQVPQANAAWRAGTITLFLLSS
jgi:hypothetical protein